MDFLLTAAWKFRCGNKEFKVVVTSLIMLKELENYPKIHNSTRLGDLKIRILSVAPKVDEKGETLRVGEKRAF